MAIQVNGTQVIGNSRELTNIASVDATTVATLNAGGVGGGGFEPQTVSGTSQSLNLSDFNFFEAGNLSTTAATTVTFGSVPTNARWQYSYITQPSTAIGYYLNGAQTADSEWLGDPQNVFLAAGGFGKPDGTRFYEVDYYGTIRQYSLSTPYDMSTSSYVKQKGSFNRSGGSPSIEAGDHGIWFKPDGTRMFLTEGNDPNAYIHAYNLSTAWDIGTASTTPSSSLNISSQVQTAFWLTMKPDGTKLYISTNINSGNTTYRGSIIQYDMSTAYDLSTASFSKYKNMGAYALNTLSAIGWSSDGGVLIATKANSNSQYRTYTYAAATPFDPTTIGDPDFDYILAPAELFRANGTSNTGVVRWHFWKNDGTKMIGFVRGNGTNVPKYNWETTGLTSPTFPSSLSASVPVNTTASKRITLDFKTQNGGTDVTLISRTET